MSIPSPNSPSPSPRSAGLTWGLLGASRILERALLPAMRTAGHTPHALGARDPARAAALAASWGIATGGSYDALLADPAIDAVYISTTNETHAPWIIRALCAGKHVLCEKPLTLGPDEVDAIRAAEHATGCRTMEAFVHGFHPQIAHARDLIAAGAIGRPVAIDAQFCTPPPGDGDFRWHARHGGGALLDLGTYCVALARDLVAEPHRAAAIATMRNDVDATTHGLLDFGTVTARFTCSFETAWSQSMLLVGEAGTFAFQLPFSSKHKTVVTTHNGEPRSWPPCDPYQAMIEHFAAAIITGGPLRHDSTDALRQAQTLRALQLSSRSARFEPIRAASAAAELSQAGSAAAACPAAPGSA